MIAHTTPPFFLFESRLSGKPARLYQNATESFSVNTSTEVIIGLKTIESWQASGDHAVVLAAYEAASAFGLPVCEPNSNASLLEAYRFSEVNFLSDAQVSDYLDTQINKRQSLAVKELALRSSEQAYSYAFKEVKKAIRRGDTYQVNLTSAYTWRYEGDELAWYRLLRDKQPVDYSALLALPDKTVLSLSPELFYCKEQGTIITKPMKGTSKRDLHDPEKDRALAEKLKKCIKNRAENVMIVDLMRNDLNRIAKPGSVKVTELCAVETYPTVYQMVSTVTADVDPSLPLSDVFSALFPSGSITGAPKHSTMQCIKALEKAPRGIYTGTIGFVTPENYHCFNIPIRTLCLSDGEGHLGVGGGLVHQSTCHDEFFEMTLKAQFFHDALAEKHHQKSSAPHMCHPQEKSDPPRCHSQEKSDPPLCHSQEISDPSTYHFQEQSDPSTCHPQERSDVGGPAMISLCKAKLEIFKNKSLTQNHIAIIDHRDSFTHTLADYCVQLGAKVSVFAIDLLPDVQSLKKQKVTHVLFSAGPGHPSDYPESLALLKAVQNDWPVLGVCLGHQMLAYASGAEVLEAEEIMHGRCSELSHDSQGLWEGFPEEALEVMRYHSLAVPEKSIQKGWVVDARADNGTVMSMRYSGKPLFGLQFHPESVLSKQGLNLLQAFLSIEVKI